MEKQHSILKSKGIIILSPAARFLIFMSLLVLVGNLGAVVDLIVHPEIDYFDIEHLVVGSVTSLVVGVILALLFKYLIRLEKSIHSGLQIEKVLQENQQKYKTIFDKASDGIVIAQDGIVKLHNTSIASMLGYEVAEVEGAAFSKFIPPENVDYYYDRYTRRLKGEALPTIYEAFLLHKNGQKILTEINASIIQFEGKRADLVIIRNISERKKTESLLRESEDRFYSLYDASFDAILLTSSEGEILAANPATCKMFERTEQEIIDIGRSGIVDITDPRLANALEERDRTGKFMGELRLIRKSGAFFPGEVSTSIFIDKAGNQNTSMIIRDITERKRREEDVRLKNEHLQTLNETKDKLFKIIAHDLRSPFHGFLGLTQSMTEQADTFSVEELKKYSRGMNEAAQNMYTLLKNLLEWAQMQDGSMSFSPKSFSLTDIIKENVTLVAARCLQKSLTINNTVHEKVEIFADPKMINSVLLNLLTNSIKFTKSGGTITLGAKLQNDNTLQMFVSDTGVGMNSDMLGKLFNIGEKIGSKGTEGELSTGLGLLLCKEFIERHGGEIWAESAESIGSTFYFTLPIISYSQPELQLPQM